MEESNNFEYTASVAEETLRKAKRKITVSVGVFVLLVMCSLTFTHWKIAADVDYLDGNVLKLARTGSASTGNVWKGGSFVSQLTWCTLFLTDSSFTEEEPYLAESLIVSEDGLEYTVVLKEGLLWSDGEPLTVDDVVFSIEASLLSPSTSNIFNLPFQQILGVSTWLEVGIESWENGGTHRLEGLSTDGDRTLYITLANPYSSFPTALTQFVILPKHILEDRNPSTFTTDLEDFFQNPVCSGMYMVDKVNEDGDLELIHNPYYHDTHSDIERVVLYGDYQNMHIDYYGTSNLTEMVSYRNMTGFEEYEVSVQYYRYFVFNLMGGYEQPELVPAVDEDGEILLDQMGEVILVESGEPGSYGEDRPENVAMQNYKFRQAVSLAIDRERILKDVYLSSGRYTFELTGNEEYVDFISTYDLELAQKLLDESGYDMERPLRIVHYHTDANSLALLARVKASLESLGLTVIVSQTSGTVSMYEDREYDILLKAYSGYNSQEWFSEYLSSSALIKTLLGTDEFDDLTVELEGATNQEEYDEAWAEMQELDRLTMYKVPILTTNASVYINGNRISLPEDMVFGNTLYRSDLRFDEWSVKKG